MFFSSVSHWTLHKDLAYLPKGCPFFLNNKGKAPPPHHKPTLQHTHARLSLPSSLSLPFLGCSSFFSMWRRDCMTAFPTPCGPKPGERKTLLLTLQVWEEVTTSSPESEHALKAEAHTLTHPAASVKPYGLLVNVFVEGKRICNSSEDLGVDRTT